ncbi:MipA/OmpV family protein [Sulfitobacter albidus]|uniref:MipA/OmpV family protein n=1 Tax=Sulfitobacter albidus TaxID=2829501 RepID=A0A975JGW6_9RHOB|nr:MipA/OmpV family protein [Sulfitobacter albidus]QUJ78299.1 MipA/OmpV family protein [Sulfitobacter albidus]
MRFGLIGTTGLALVLALPVAAQERSFEFSLRGGVGAAPEYPGSDDYEAVPDLGFTFGALRWGNFSAGNGVRGVAANGFGVRGAFKVIGGRDIEALDEIDTAVELGLGLTYQQTNWRAFGEVRKGVTGHSGVTGTLGADVIFRDAERWVISAGPRVNFGDSDYANTYFGVSGVEAATSSLNAFDADGGALGAGIEVQGAYYLDDRWAIEGAVSYEKLIGDAGDSPVTQLGSDDQFRIRVGLSRVFNLNF